MTRRKFFQTSCTFCLLGATGTFLSELEACSPSYQVINTEIIDDTIQIGLASFAHSNLQLVRPTGWLYDIAVQKKENEYEALLLECTHQKNQLVPAGNGFFAVSMAVSLTSMESFKSLLETLKIFNQCESGEIFANGMRIMVK
jgi:hypothetical protein